MSNDAKRQAAAQQTSLPLTSDPQLSWAPVDANRLFCLVAKALESNASFVQLRSEAQKEHHEWMQASQAHAQAAAAVSNSERLNVLVDSATKKRRDWIAAERKREQVEAYWAFERYHHALVCGFAVHPVVWLYLALLGAAACLRSIEETYEVHFTTRGTAEGCPNRQGRATFFACMVEVRQAFLAILKKAVFVITIRHWKARGSTHATPGWPQGGINWKKQRFEKQFGGNLSVDYFSKA